MTPEVLGMPSPTSSDELDSEPKAQIGADSLDGDFRQCPEQYFEELHTKFHNAKLRCEASSVEGCHSVSVVPKKTVPPLTARQLGGGQDDELSESWKRFEWRKQKRKERSHSKNRLRQLNLRAANIRWSNKALRLFGQITSQMAQPPEAFSYRSPSDSEESIFMTQVESTAYRKWM